jgi:hypothetical protein
MEQRKHMPSNISGSYGGERPDDEGSKHLRNVGEFQRDYTAEHPRDSHLYMMSN